MACDTNVGVWCSDALLWRFITKHFESFDISFYFAVRFFSFAVLQVWRTICSSGLGHLICIHPLHHSLHSVEVTARMLVFVPCLSVVQMVVLLLIFVITCYHTATTKMFSLRLTSERSQVNVWVCLCVQDTLPDRNEQSRQWSWQRSYWLPP